MPNLGSYGVTPTLIPPTSVHFELRFRESKVVDVSEVGLPCTAVPRSTSSRTVHLKSPPLSCPSPLLPTRETRPDFVLAPRATPAMYTPPSISPYSRLVKPRERIPRSW